jgi:hypothetical protein
MDELLRSTEAYLQDKPYPPKFLPHPYAFNLFSHNSAVDSATLYNTGHSVSLFVCGDQLLKGAALNAVQIAQLFLA